MAILPILTFPDPRLREVSKTVEKVTPEIQKLVDDMLETMNHAKGIGLAAPQVAQPIRLLVIDIRRPPEPDEEDQELTELEAKVKYPLVLINPVIIGGEGKTSYEEGCLSVPGYYEEVLRFNWVQVEALDRNGKKFLVETDGLLAICIQHEMDHLEGKLFIDRLSFVKSNKIKNKIKKLGYPLKKEREQSKESSKSKTDKNTNEIATSSKKSNSKSKVEV